MICIVTYTCNWIFENKQNLASKSRKREISCIIKHTLFTVLSNRTSASDTALGSHLLIDVFTVYSVVLAAKIVQDLIDFRVNSKYSIVMNRYARIPVLVLMPVLNKGRPNCQFSHYLKIQSLNFCLLSTFRHFNTN